MITVYLTGPFVQPEEMTHVDADLKRIGIATCYSATDDSCARAAWDTWQAIQSSNILIWFSVPVPIGYDRRTREVEFGLSYASEQCEVWIVGPREHYLHHLPGVTRYETWAEAMVELTRRAEESRRWPPKRAKAAAK